jgi:hypothetical protein
MPMHGSTKSRWQLLGPLAKLSFPVVSTTSCAFFFFLFRYGFYKIFECFVIASADPRKIHMARAMLSFSEKKRKEKDTHGQSYVRGVSVTS